MVPARTDRVSGAVMVAGQLAGAQRAVGDDADVGQTRGAVGGRGARGRGRGGGVGPSSGRSEITFAGRRDLGGAAGGKGQCAGRTAIRASVSRKPVEHSHRVWKRAFTTGAVRDRHPRRVDSSAPDGRRGRDQICKARTPYSDGRARLCEVEFAVP